MARADFDGALAAICEHVVLLETDCARYSEARFELLPRLCYHCDLFASNLPSGGPAGYRSLQNDRFRRAR